jgi:hemerythrin-like domain-containing protein
VGTWLAHKNSGAFFKGEPPWRALFKGSSPRADNYKWEIPESPEFSAVPGMHPAHLEADRFQTSSGEITMKNVIDTNKPGCAHAANETQSGGCGHQHFEKATQMLSDEHRVIERVLAVLQKLTTRPVENSLDSWRKALDFFSHFADQCHHFKEEQVLFPAMEEHGIPREGGPIGMMLMEHEEGRSYVKAMLAAIPLVEAKNEVAKEILVDKAKAYLRLLKEHIQKEDEILFKIADDVIPAEEQKDLLRSFEEHEAKEMGEGAHEKYLKIAEELEAIVR